MPPSLQYHLSTMLEDHLVKKEKSVLRLSELPPSAEVDSSSVNSYRKTQCKLKSRLPRTRTWITSSYTHLISPVLCVSGTSRPLGILSQQGQHHLQEGRSDVNMLLLRLGYTCVLAKNLNVSLIPACYKLYVPHGRELDIFFSISQHLTWS